jgi:hypothetical protein
LTNNLIVKNNKNKGVKMVKEKIEVPKNSLWQYVAKEHLAPNISQKKWDKFVEECGDDFAEKTSLIANEMFQQWSDI